MSSTRPGRRPFRWLAFAPTPAGERASEADTAACCAGGTGGFVAACFR